METTEPRSQIKKTSDRWSVKTGDLETVYRDGDAAAGLIAMLHQEILRLKRLNATYVADNGRTQDQLRAEIGRLASENK